MSRISETEESTNYAKARQSFQNLNCFFFASFGVFGGSITPLALAGLCHFERSREISCCFGPLTTLHRRHDRNLVVGFQFVIAIDEFDTGAD
jgi:hypothetical protein